MLEQIKEALAAHEGEPGIVGYALVVFIEGGDVALDAGVSTEQIDADYMEEVAEAIAEVAAVLGFDGEEVVLQ